MNDSTTTCTALIQSGLRACWMHAGSGYLLIHFLSQGFVYCRRGCHCAYLLPGLRHPPAFEHVLCEDLTPDSSETDCSSAGQISSRGRQQFTLTPTCTPTHPHPHSHLVSLTQHFVCIAYAHTYVRMYISTILSSHFSRVSVCERDRDTLHLHSTFVPASPSLPPSYRCPP